MTVLLYYTTTKNFSLGLICSSVYVSLGAFCSSVCREKSKKSFSFTAIEVITLCRERGKSGPQKTNWKRHKKYRGCVTDKEKFPSRKKISVRYQESINYPHINITRIFLL